MKKNTFWAVYRKGKVITISFTKRNAQEQALTISNHQWTHWSFKKDWQYLVNDGYTVEKSNIKSNIKMLK